MKNIKWILKILNKMVIILYQCYSFDMEINEIIKQVMKYLSHLNLKYADI